MLDNKQYWADAMTRNCVWLFQIKVEIGEDESYWRTTMVFLTREEALKEGTSRPYEYGKVGKDWRCYGIPCYGIMSKIIGKHTEEFKDKVDSVLDDWKEKKDDKEYPEYKKEKCPNCKKEN